MEALVPCPLRTADDGPTWRPNAICGGRAADTAPGSSGWRPATSGCRDGQAKSPSAPRAATTARYAAGPEDRTAIDMAPGRVARGARHRRHLLCWVVFARSTRSSADLR